VAEAKHNTESLKGERERKIAVNRRKGGRKVIKFASKRREREQPRELFVKQNSLHASESFKVHAVSRPAATAALRLLIGKLIRNYVRKTTIKVSSVTAVGGLVIHSDPAASPAATTFREVFMAQTL
jgi:hypothetical protein